MSSSKPEQSLGVSNQLQYLLNNLPSRETLIDIDAQALESVESESYFPQNLDLPESGIIIYLYTCDETTPKDHLREEYTERLLKLPGVEIHSANSGELVCDACEDFPTAHIWAGPMNPISPEMAIQILIESAKIYNGVSRLTRCNAMLVNDKASRRKLISSLTACLNRVEVKAFTRLPSISQLRRTGINLMRRILTSGDGESPVIDIEPNLVYSVLRSPRASANNWFRTKSSDSQVNRECLRPLERELYEKKAGFVITSSAQSRIIYTVICAMCYTLVAYNWSNKIRPISYDPRPMSQIISGDSDQRYGFYRDRRRANIWPEQYALHSTPLGLRLRSVRETSFDLEHLTRSLQ